MKVLGYNLETSTGRENLFSLVNRWTLTILIFSMITVMTGIGCSVLLFLGDSSPLVVDQVVGGIHLLMAIVLMILLIVVWIYFDKLKEKIEFDTKRPTQEEKFVTRTNRQVITTQSAMADSRAVTTNTQSQSTNDQTPMSQSSAMEQFLQNSQKSYDAYKANMI